MSKTLSNTIKPLQVRAVNPNTARAKYDRKHNPDRPPDDFEVGLGGGWYVSMWRDEAGHRLLRVVKSSGVALSSSGLWMDERHEKPAEWARGVVRMCPGLDADALVEAARLLRVVAELA